MLPAPPVRQPLLITAAVLIALAIFTAGLLVGRRGRTTPPSSSTAVPTSGQSTSTTVTGTPQTRAPATTLPSGPQLAPGIAAPFDTKVNFPELTANPTPTLWVAAGTTGGEGSKTKPFGSINQALSTAQAGDVIMVGAGSYTELVRSVRDGEASRPIRLIGADGASLTPLAPTDRLVQFDHRYLTLEGFRLSGADKLLWLQKTKGVRVLRNTFESGGGECIRLKYFATDNEVAKNTIKGCGKVNFDYPAGTHKNGEGIYIGTAPEQLISKNPTPEPDASDRNWIHDNIIETKAECVDIKEGASANLIQANRCTGQIDPDGSAFDSRGNGNYFIANAATSVVGAGVRLGGDTKEDGQNNVVIGNELRSTGGYAVKLENPSQRAVCGNTIGDNAAGSASRKNGAPIYRPEAPC